MAVIHDTPREHPPQRWHPRIRTLLLLLVLASALPIVRTRRVLERLAARPEFQTPDPRRILDLFREYVGLHPELTNLVLVDASGRVVCSLIPSPAGLDVADLPGFKDILGGKTFTVAGPEVGRISGRWVMLPGLAVRDHEGRLTGIIVAPIDAVRGMGIFQRVEMPAGGVLAAVGRS